MYNPPPPLWPLFRSRLMKLYPRISKKALWKSSLIEVSDKLNMSKLYDNKISWTLSIFLHKPLIFCWQNLIPFFDMSVLNSLLSVGPSCNLMSPHSSNNNKHTDFFVVVTYFNFIPWNVDKTKLSRPSYNYICEWPSYTNAIWWCVITGCPRFLNLKFQPFNHHFLYIFQLF